MEVHAGQVRLPDSGQPDAAGEVAVPQWRALRAGEDRTVIAVLGVLVQMVGQISAFDDRIVHGTELAEPESPPARTSWPRLVTSRSTTSTRSLPAGHTRRNCTAGSIDRNASR
jgi:hypothetical protein